MRERFPSILVAVMTAVLVLTGTVDAHASWPLVLRLSPNVVTAGATVTVSGEGFNGGRTGEVRSAGVLLGGFTTDVHGRFRSTLKVPATLSGTVAVTATASGRTATTMLQVVSSPQDTRLAWRAPSVPGATVLRLTKPGTYNLRADVDYVVSAPQRIDGPVHLRGGRNIVWIGGHIHIPRSGPGPIDSALRRGLVVSDIDAIRGGPAWYGRSVEGRVIHVEGLLIDGPDLAEGINTNAPTAVVQLQNIRIDGVHFRNSDDRDGTNGWRANHPDLLQIWGSQRELRVDGFTGSSAYQGLFLKEDAVDSRRGPIRLRRVNLVAYEHLGDDGYRYAGHRMLSWYEGWAGSLHLDEGTVWIASHPRSGWNRAVPNPRPDTDFWHSRYWSVGARAYIQEPTPGGATLADAVGNVAPMTGRTALGPYVQWSTPQVRNWDGNAPGRIFGGTPPQGDYVPSGAAGTTYRAPGYR